MADVPIHPIPEVLDFIFATQGQDADLARLISNVAEVGGVKGMHQLVGTGDLFSDGRYLVAGGTHRDAGQDIPLLSECYVGIK